MKKLHESMQFYFSKLRRPSVSPTRVKPSSSYSTCRILPRCRIPRTTSFALERSTPCSPSDDTLVSPTKFSYVHSEECWEYRFPVADAVVVEWRSAASMAEDDVSVGLTVTTEEDDDGSSNSWDSAASSVATAVVCQRQQQESAIAVLRKSENPYEDFRRSMEEMVKAKGEEDGVDWEFMEGLLFCYLNLNEETSHGYIIRAFSDLVVASSKALGGR